MEKIDLEKEIEKRLAKMFDENDPERKERCMTRAKERDLFKQIAKAIETPR